jgi:flagellar motility protein MotE (MotC chaperone)
MLMAFLLLGLKVGEVMHDGRLLALSFAEASAETEAGKDAAKPAGDAKPAEGAKGAEDPKVNPPSTTSDSENEKAPPKPEFSQVEIDLLESLAKRRQELDNWAKQIQLKQNMMNATELRINDKIASLEKVKKQVEDLLAQYNQQEDTKIKSLVKIYENMKPKDAARIFEELDMPVLLMVVDRMNERKVAPVLAAMSPTKAKDVTVQLAEQRRRAAARYRGRTSFRRHYSCIRQSLPGRSG